MGPGHHPRRHPHLGELADDAERHRKREERRDTIESNKAWRSAETVRREFVTTLLTRKLAREYAEAGHELRTAMERGHSQARAFLGLPAEDNGPLCGFRDGAATLVALLDGVTDARAQVITLALILGAQESATGIALLAHQQPRHHPIPDLPGQAGEPAARTTQRGDV